VKVEKIGRGTRNASLRFASSGEDKQVFVSSEIFWLIAFVVNQNALRGAPTRTKQKNKIERHRSQLHDLWKEIASF